MQVDKAAQDSGPHTPVLHNGESLNSFLVRAREFHGYLAPGLVIGSFMVNAAQSRLSSGVLYDAICETPYCLPDAIQLLTPCTIGNGWLRILDFGRYALSLYDKTSGQGIRVGIDAEKIRSRPVIRDWFYKLTPKKQQDTERLLQDILEAEDTYFSVQEVEITPQHRMPRHKGSIADCSVCGEAYPASHGDICRCCGGEDPYHYFPAQSAQEKREPVLKAVSLSKAIGCKLLHDVTEIVPAVSKGPLFRKGHLILDADLCRLQKIGRNTVYVDNSEAPEGFVHENEAARRFAKAFAGEGVVHSLEAVEGKITLFAGRNGLLLVDANRLRAFNRIFGVMGAFRKNYSVVKKGDKLGGTRSIPLFLPESDCLRALNALAGNPAIRVAPMIPMDAGILVTGTEVFNGLVQDQFTHLITRKLAFYGCRVAGAGIVPDNVEAIRVGIAGLMEKGARLIITTAGLSVDPDDVTREGLALAGATDMLYGAPVLPGAMTLLARIGNIPVMGVPACALYFKATSFDRLLPRILAGIRISREDLAEMGHGAFCLECETCRYPNCGFGQ